MSNQEKIDRLKKELAKYSKGDQKRLKAIEERQEISELKRQIRQKKYAGVVQTGRNLKIIGKRMGKGFSAVGKGMGKFVGDPKTKTGKKRLSVEEVLKKLPQ